MFIIQPCCTKKNLYDLLEAIKNGGTKKFECYEDMSLEELLPALLTRYAETDMLIAAPHMPDQAADALARWMRRKWMRADGKGKLDVIGHLTIIASLDATRVSMWAEDNPFGERLNLIDRQQQDYVLLMPDLAILGFKNMRYGKHFEATATTDPDKIAELWKKYKSYKNKKMRRKQQPTQ